MRCVIHQDREAVAQCVDCGGFLCAECAEKFNPRLCDSCFAKRKSKMRSDAIKTIVISAILACVGVISIIGSGAGKSDEGSANYFLAMIFMAYACAGAPWGWKALSKLTSRYFLFLPIAGWALYFSVKAGLAFCVGLFVFPFKLYNAIKEVKSN